MCAMWWALVARVVLRRDTDAKHELPAAFSVERASVSEQTVLPRGLRRLFESEPLLAEGCTRFSADRGCDQANLEAWLWCRHGVRPKPRHRRVPGHGVRQIHPRGQSHRCQSGPVPCAACSMIRRKPNPAPENSRRGPA